MSKAKITKKDEIEEAQIVESVPEEQTSPMVTGTDAANVKATISDRPEISRVIGEDELSFYKADAKNLSGLMAAFPDGPFMLENVAYPGSAYGVIRFEDGKMFPVKKELLRLLVKVYA